MSKKISVTIQLDKEMLDHVDKVAGKFGISRARVIRDAVAFAHKVQAFKVLSVPQSPEVTEP